MTESGFNLPHDAAQFEMENEELLPIPSSRFLFYRVRRYGMAHFVKRPRPECADNLLVVEALKKEFYTGFSLNHPGIVRYLHFDSGSVYEEYIEGATLRQLLKEKDSRLKDTRFIREVARQLFEVLDYLHSQGILHLDIKPENVMITRVGNRLKLIDFSCARSATCYATPGFTPGFMAPEQAGPNQDATTDIYLAGKLLCHISSDRSMSRSLKRFVAKATAEERGERFQTAKEALDALPEGDRKVNRIGVFSAAVGLVSLLGIGLLFFRDKPADAETRHKSVVDTVVVRQEAETLPIQVPGYNREPEPVEKPIVAPAPTPVPAPGQTPTPTAVGNVASGNSQGALNKKIESHIKGYFNRNIYPLFNEASRYEEGVKSQEFMDKIRQKMSKAYDDIMVAYAASLKNQYPAESLYIDSYIFQVFLSQSKTVDAKLSR